MKNIYIGLLTLLFLFSQKDSKYFVVYLSILVLLIIFSSLGCITIENFEISNEAVQNIASIYNSDKISVSNADITSSLTTNNLYASTISSPNITLASTNSSDNYGYSLNRTDENNKNHIWNLLHANQAYGQNDLQFWELKAGTDGLACNSSSSDAICSPHFIVKSGGNIEMNNNLSIKKDLSIINNLTSTGNISTTGNLSIGGNLIQNNIYRKHNIAGYFHINQNSFKIPLYYGWNMMYPDTTKALNLRKNSGFDQSMISFSGITAVDDDLIQKKNKYRFFPRYLIVFPGYIARLYYDDVPSTDIDVFTSGEHNLENPLPPVGFGKVVSLIYISLDEEGPYSANLNKPSLLTK